MDIKEVLLKNKNESIIFDENSNLNQENLLDTVAHYLNCGIKIIQYFDKSKSDKINLETAVKLRQLCSMFDALLIINHRADIAQLSKADGICLDDNDLSEIQVLEIIDDNKFIAFFDKNNPEIIDFKIKTIKTKRHTNDDNS